MLMRWTGGLHAGEGMLRPLERLLRARGIDEPIAQDAFLTDHVVIAGYGVAGQLLARTLAQARVPYVILELNAETVRDARREYTHVYYGDVTSPEALAHARLGHARVLVLLINDSQAARRAIVTAHAEWPNVPIVVRTRYVAERPGLLALGATQVVCEELEGGTEMSAWVLRMLGQDPGEIRSGISDALASSTAGDLTVATGEWVEAVDAPRGLPTPFGRRPGEPD